MTKTIILNYTLKDSTALFATLFALKNLYGDEISILTEFKEMHWIDVTITASDRCESVIQNGMASLGL